MRTPEDTVRQQYRELSENERVDMAAVKEKGADMLRTIETIESRAGPSRATSIAKTKIEEAVMWAVKHITR